MFKNHNAHKWSCQCTVLTGGSLSPTLIDLYVNMHFCSTHLLLFALCRQSESPVCAAARRPSTETLHFSPTKHSQPSLGPALHLVSPDSRSTATAAARESLQSPFYMEIKNEASRHYSEMCDQSLSKHLPLSGIISNPQSLSLPQSSCCSSSVL